MPPLRSFRRISSGTWRACPFEPGNLRFSTAVESSSGGMRSRDDSHTHPRGHRRFGGVGGALAVEAEECHRPTPGAVHLRIRPSVAILGFKNLSGRPDTAWISTALSEMLTTELAAGEQMRTVPDETVARTRIDLGLADVESLSRDTLTQVRKNLGSDFVILGSISTWERIREAASTFVSRTRSKEKLSLPSRKRARKKPSLTWLRR